MSRRSLDQAAARKTFALVAAAFALKPLGFCYLALRIGSGAVRPMPAGSRKVKGEPKSPQTAEPPPRTPGSAQEVEDPRDLHGHAWFPTWQPVQAGGSFWSPSRLSQDGIFEMLKCDNGRLST